MASNILIEVSARHCHLCQEHVDSLFGNGYKLNILREISQPGQFAAKETIALETTSGSTNLRIIGPVRGKTQIEISASDARNLGINPPIRLSGDITNSSGGKLIGPQGSVEITEGIIIALPHIHCDPNTAVKHNLVDKEIVSVQTIGVRPVTFHNVSVRVSDTFKPSFHIDTDQANATFPDGKISEGIIIKQLS